MAVMNSGGREAIQVSTELPVPEPRSLAPTPGDASEDHPTVKPTALPEDTLLDSSGSTLIAAQATGRVCRGVELDPLYVDVIVRRYEAAIGNHAVLVVIGETLDLLAARRSSEPAPV